MLHSTQIYMTDATILLVCDIVTIFNQIWALFTVFKKAVVQKKDKKQLGTLILEIMQDHAETLHPF